MKLVIYKKKDGTARLYIHQSVLGLFPKLGSPSTMEVLEETISESWGFARGGGPSMSGYCSRYANTLGDDLESIQNFVNALSAFFEYLLEKEHSRGKPDEICLTSKDVQGVI